jgi:hypothetical protein
MWRDQLKREGTELKLEGNMNRKVCFSVGNGSVIHHLKEIKKDV